MDKESQKKIAARRIFDARVKLGMKQKEFAEFLGLEPEVQPNISKWENAKQLPSPHYASILAQKTGGNSLYFQGLDPLDDDAEPSPSRLFPLVGELQAGQWHETYEWDPSMISYIPLPEAFGDIPRNSKAFRVKGTSMNKIYPEGSIVFVADIFTNKVEARDGDIIVIRRMDKFGLYEASLKELVIDGDGKKWAWPRSDDPEHQTPLSLSGGNHSGTDVTIVGVVAAGISRPIRNR